MVRLLVGLQKVGVVHVEISLENHRKCSTLAGIENISDSQQVRWAVLYRVTLKCVDLKICGLTCAVILWSGVQISPPGFFFFGE